MGIAAGIGSIEIAVVITVFFNFSTLFIMAFGDGLESRYVAQKRAVKQKQKMQAQNPNDVPVADQADEPTAKNGDTD